MSDDGDGINIDDGGGGEETRGITEFTETTTEGLGSRLQGACWGICLGIILFIGAFPFLFWNEGRAVDRYEALNEAESETVTVSGLNIDPANNGKVLHFTVDIMNNGTELFDTTFGIKSLDGLVLRREAEMYQWKEKVTTTTKKGYGGKKTTTKNYSYDKVWSSSLINSGSFKKPDGHQNPSTMEFTSTTITGNPITIGAYILPESLKSRLNWYKPLAGVTKENITDINLRDRAVVTNGEIYFANKMTSLNPTTTSNTSPNTSGSGTRQYFVVAQTNRNLPSSSNVNVVYTSYNLNDAKAYMMKEFPCGPDSNYPQRMIVEAVNNVVQVEQCGACDVLFGGNPLKQCCKTGLINGESQLLENGYNKFWWGGEEIYTMVSAARNYVTTPYTLATWTVVNNNNPVVPCNQPPVSSPPTTVRPSTPPPAAVRPTLPTAPVTPVTPNPTTKPTTAQPTPIPTQNPTTLKPTTLKPTTALVRPPLAGECVDTANYQDIYGGTCAEYESNAAWCGGYGTTGEPGKTPNENCCVCIAKLSGSGSGSGEEEISLGGIRGRRLQSTTSGAPMIGDQRVSFSEVPPSTITIVGVQQGNEIAAFVADNGEGGDVLLFKQGQWTSVQMYDEAEAANAATTWILRFVGFAAMSLGLYLIFRPIEVFADIIPCVGSIIGCGIIFMAIFISAFLSTITISIAWLAAQPKIGAIVLVVMLVVVGGCGFGYKKFKGRGKDDDDEDVNEKIDKLGSMNDDEVVKVASTTIPTVNAAPEQPVVIVASTSVPTPQEAEITVNATPERPPLATVPQPYVP